MNATPEVDQSPPEVERVGVLLRIEARLIDAIVLVIPVLLFTGPIAGGLQILVPNSGIRLTLAADAAVLILYLYFVACERQFGKTLGKAAVGLAVRSQSGSVSTQQALRRN